MATDYGLKIAKPGIPVTVAQPQDQVFSTLFQTLPIAISRTIDVTGNAGGLPTTTIKHGLGFVPLFMVYYKSSKNPTYWQWAPDGGADFLLGVGSSIFSQRIDKENLIIQINFNNGSAETITIRYIIFNFAIALSI